MGGAYGLERASEMQRQWAASSAEVRMRQGRPIVPAAQLRVGLGTHRALLFKFLSDASNVPCRLIGRSQCKGETMQLTSCRLTQVRSLLAHIGHDTQDDCLSSQPAQCDLRASAVRLSAFLAADFDQSLSQEPALLSIQYCCLASADAQDAAAVAVVCFGARELAVDLTASPGAVRPWKDLELAGASAGKLRSNLSLRPRACSRISIQMQSKLSVWLQFAEQWPACTCLLRCDAFLHLKPARIPLQFVMMTDVRLTIAGVEDSGTRPPSVELQKVAVADTAPNLAQVGTDPKHVLNDTTREGDIKRWCCIVEQHICDKRRAVL